MLARPTTFISIWDLCFAYKTNCIIYGDLGDMPDLSWNIFPENSTSSWLLITDYPDYDILDNTVSYKYRITIINGVASTE